jgi:hypothetical protein
MVKEWFTTPENAFSLLQSSMTASFTLLQPTLGTALGDLRLVCGCSAMETHFMKLPTNSSCAVWNSVVRVATEDAFYELCASALGSCLWACGLPLRSWAVVAQICFHFTITALTVGSSSRAETWQTDLLEWWHPMVVPRWKSLSSSVRPFYCQWLSMEIAWLCTRFYTLVINRCGWNSRIY